MTDPSLMNLTSYKELFHLVDEYFIRGVKSDLTEKEEIIKNSKFKLVFENLKYKDDFLVAINGIRQLYICKLRFQNLKHIRDILK